MNYLGDNADFNLTLLNLDFSTPTITDQTLKNVHMVDNTTVIERVDIGSDNPNAIGVEDVIIGEASHHSHDHGYGEEFDSEIVTGQFISQIEDDPIVSMLEEDSYIDSQEFLKNYHENKQDSNARFSFKVKHIGDAEDVRKTRDEYISEFKQSRVLGDYFGNRVLVNTNRDKDKEFIFGYQVENDDCKTYDEMWQKNYQTLQELDDDKALLEHLTSMGTYNATIDVSKLQSALQSIAKKQAKNWVESRRDDTLKELRKLKANIVDIQAGFNFALENLTQKVTAAIQELDNDEIVLEANTTTVYQVLQDEVEQLQPILLDTMEDHIRISQEKTAKELGPPLSFEHLERKGIKGFPTTLHKHIDDYTQIVRDKQIVKRALPKV